MRIRQTLRTVLPKHMDPGTRAAALATLTGDQREEFLQLPQFDQNHLICVYASLYRSGHRDPDLLAAALLHDIGKHRQGRSVKFIDRALKVLLERIAPSLLQRLALPAPGSRANGLTLAVHHPAIGATRARQLGSSELTCWLIQHHEDQNASDSDLLAALQKADGAC